MTNPYEDFPHTHLWGKIDDGGAASHIRRCVICSAHLTETYGRRDIWHIVAVSGTLLAEGDGPAPFGDTDVGELLPEGADVEAIRANLPPVLECCECEHFFYTEGFELFVIGEDYEYSTGRIICPSGYT